MRENPVFEIRGRALLTAIGYMIVGIILIVATQAIVSMMIFGTLELGFMVFLILALVLVTLLCFYAAYRAFELKTVRIDGNYFYYFHGDTLKKRIPLKDINKVRIGPFILYTYLSFKYITIYYLEHGRRKRFHISEDLFPFRELQIIFREFTRYAQSHKIMMVPR
jgi:hypothetical protein